MARAIELRVVQCRVAIAACKRYKFSPPLLRALSAKVLELETDALMLRRALRGKREPRAKTPREGVNESRRFSDRRRGPRGRDARAKSG